MEKLYEHDLYLTKFSARVLSCVQGKKGFDMANITEIHHLCHLCKIENWYQRIFVPIIRYPDRFVNCNLPECVVC